MDGLLRFALVAFGTVFAIVDPLGLVPPFLAITPGETVARRRGIAKRACLIGAVVLVAFGLAGSLIFRFFGITLHAFRIAGGVLLFLVALDMLRARHSGTKTTPEEEAEGAAKEDVAVIPLGIPLLAGPGAIASVMMLTGRAGTTAEHAVVYGAILLTVAIAYTALRAAEPVSRVLGKTGLNVLTRLMGLILAAIAVQFVIDGLTAALPAVGAAAPGGGA